MPADPDTDGGLGGSGFGGGDAGRDDATSLGPGGGRAEGQGLEQGVGQANPDPGGGEPMTDTPSDVTSDTPSEVVCPPAPTRLVRLSFAQQANAVEALLGLAIANQVRGALRVDDAVIYPSALLREGEVVSAGNFALSDQSASLAAKYVLDNFEGVTHCGPSPDRDCAENFVADFAERAYRRPLDAPSVEALMEVFSEVLDVGGSVQEAVQYGVHATLVSPQFLYRTEFGAPGAAEADVALTSYELASAVSFFLTNGPPDAALLSAAADDSLSTPEGISLQVDRLLASDVTRAHLTQVMLDYFDAWVISRVILEEDVAPEFDAELKSALEQEVIRFMHMHLWKTPLGELLTTRESEVNARLAEHYGIADFESKSVDQDGFASVTLPPERAGLLTMAGLLVVLARPYGGSVPHRGEWIRRALFCTEYRTFPEGVDFEFVDVPPDASEKEKAQARADNPVCSTCHDGIDPYGLVLESFDLMGRRRSVDQLGRAIDTGVTLPDEVGGGTIDEVAELGARIDESGLWRRCVTDSVFDYAMARQVEGCSVYGAIKPAMHSDATFGDIVRGIVVSRAFAIRRNED